MNTNASTIVVDLAKFNDTTLEKLDKMTRLNHVAIEDLLTNLIATIDVADSIEVHNGCS